jgi:hypothetical protein
MYAVLRPTHTSLVFIFDLDGCYWQQLRIPYAPGTACSLGLWFLDADNILKDLVENIQPGVAQVGHLRLFLRRY